MTDSTDFSYEAALTALLSPGIHQATTKEDIAKSALRRTRTVLDMRYYWNKILKHTAATATTTKPKLIHVTGTKGKGSTSCMCEAVLRSHGYSTGLFTSPHLMDIRERIRWNGKPIHPDIFARVYWTIRSALESSIDIDQEEEDPPPVLPGYFRMLTLMGLYTFVHELPSIDVIILEVGMGGRYDATNFLNADHFECVANGVTLLDLDHTRILGNTLEKIAWEKGGIISIDKLNVEGTAPRPGEKDTTTTQQQQQQQTASATTQSSFNILLDSNTPGVVKMMKACAFVEGKNGKISLADASGTKLKEALQRQGLSLGLAGSHQFGNATLAVALCQAIASSTVPIEIDSSVTTNALAKAAWPGRCQRLLWSSLPNGHDKNVEFHLDGAHTYQSLEATVDWFRSYNASAKHEPPILVFNCSHERNPVELLELLCGIGYTKVYFAKSDSSRPSPIQKASAEELLEERGIAIRTEFLAGTTTPRTWQETLSIVWKHLTPPSAESVSPVVCNMMASEILEELSALPQASSNTRVFVTGSLYLVGSFLTALGWQEESSPSLE